MTWEGESNCEVNNQVINRIQLSNGLVENADLINCKLVGCNLANAEFYKVTFTNCSFEGCDLSSSIYTQCGFWSTEFSDSKVIGINWSVSGLAVDVNFINCRLDYSSFSGLKLKNKKFKDCSAIECNFSKCDLRRSCFDGCDLKNSSFSGADVRKADFGNSSGVFIDPTISKVDSTIIGSDAAARLAILYGFSVPSIFTE